MRRRCAPSPSNEGAVDQILDEGGRCGRSCGRSALVGTQRTARQGSDRASLPPSPSMEGMTRRWLQKSTISQILWSMGRLLILVFLVGCGDDAPAIDGPPVPPDCTTYCREIQASCTATNAQYPDEAHCMAACASFTVGTSTVADTTGDTLGCRIYHAVASRAEPAIHCVHAGPAGDLLTAAPPAFCSGGDFCASFCTLQIRACGSLDAPLSGDPRDASGNPLFQYRNMENCMSRCAAFDRTHVYSITSAGDSHACRLRHATTAAIAVSPYGEMECPNTAHIPTGPCVGTPTP